MASQNKTPILNQPRSQGGTLYVFPSASEDIGLNLNSRANTVALSHFALLNIPESNTELATEKNLSVNFFNPTFIPGEFAYVAGQGNLDFSPSWHIAASLQNYAMNFETLLMNQDEYNYQELETTSERVFWKWLKETGAIRWRDDNIKTTRCGEIFEEEQDISTNIEAVGNRTGYQKVVRCFGAIDAGNSRSTEFGMFNETYVSVPTSYGGGKVYFRVKDDDGETNYVLGKAYIYDNASTLQGRENEAENVVNTYTVNVPWSDYADTFDEYTPSWSASDGTSGSDSFWWSSMLSYVKTGGAYITQKWEQGDPINYDVTYAGDNTFTFRRSNLDGVEIVKDTNDIAAIWDKLEPSVTHTVNSYDDVNVNAPDAFAPDDQFDFNAILLYYSVYDTTNSTKVPVATNLFGVLFLDAPEDMGSEETGEQTSFCIPPMTKKMSNANGFGTGYAFRVNVKTNSIYDDTDSEVNDNTTTASLLTSDFAGILSSLNQAVDAMNTNVATTKNIQESYAQVVNAYSTYSTQVKDLSTKLESYVAGDRAAVLTTAVLNASTIRPGKTLDASVLTIQVPDMADTYDTEAYVYNNVQYKTVAVFDSSGVHIDHLDVSTLNKINSYVKVTKYYDDASVFSTLLNEDGALTDEAYQMLSTIFDVKSHEVSVPDPSGQTTEASTNKLYYAGINILMASKNVEYKYIAEDGTVQNSSDRILEFYVDPDSPVLNSSSWGGDSSWNKVDLTWMMEDEESGVLYGADYKTANINYEKLIPYIIAYMQNFVANLENTIINSEAYKELSAQVETCCKNVSTLFDFASTTDTSIKIIDNSVNILERTVDRIDASLTAMWKMLEDIAFHTDYVRKENS